MRQIVKLGFIAVLAVAASCGGDSPAGLVGGNGGGGGGGGGGTGGSTSNAITVGDDFFNPSATTVPVGTTVTWTWSTGTFHNVTFSDGTRSGDQAGGTYTRTFNSAGTFSYQCTLHAGMNGSIVVK